MRRRCLCLSSLSLYNDNHVELAELVVYRICIYNLRREALHKVDGSIFIHIQVGTAFKLEISRGREQSSLKVYPQIYVYIYIYLKNVFIILKKI